MAAIGPRRLLALALAALAAAVCCAYLVRYALKPYTGLVVNYPEAVARDGRIVFAPRSPLSPAVRAGLLPYRDRILRVGRVPIGSLRDLVEADLAVGTWAPLEVEVLRDGTAPRTLSIEPDLVLRRLDTAFVVAFLVALIGLGFALLLDAGLNLATGLLAAGCFCYAVFVAVKPFYYESAASNVLIHAGKLAPWLLLAFAFEYPRPRASPAVRIGAAAAVAVAFAVFAAARIALVAEWARTGADVLLERYRLLGRFANSAEAAAYVAFVALLASALPAAAASQRARIQWMLAGFVVALPPYFFLDQLPLILGERAAPRVGTGGFANLFLLPLPLLFSVGLLTGRRLATRRMLARFVVYALVALAAVAFFALLYDPIVEQLSTHYAMTVRASAFVAVFLLAALLLPLQALLLRASARALEARPRRLGELMRENAALHRALDDPKSDRQTWERARQHELARLARYAERQVEEAGRRLGAATAALQGPGPDAAALRQAIADLRQARVLLVEFAEAARPVAALTGGLPEPCGAARLAAVAAARVRQRFPGLRVDMRMADARVRAVPQHVVAALIEVLVNAYESAPEGLVLVTSKRQSGMLRIEIKDEGAGFGAEMAAVATDPFTSGKPGHTGMGLYVARRALALCGGAVGAQAGEGGVVWIDLPLA